jgi:hypothetical protein
MVRQAFQALVYAAQQIIGLRGKRVKCAHLIAMSNPALTLSEIARPVNAVNLENRLRYIEPDCRDRLH